MVKYFLRLDLCLFELELDNLINVYIESLA